MVRTLFLLSWLCVSLGCHRGHTETVEFELDNGLYVILKPLPTATINALVVLYDIGNLHDPKGQCGMAHLAEHLYVTAATDATPARSVQQYVQAYPDGWNAQTGDDYTVFATMFRPGDQDRELDDAVSRMKQLTVTEADLRRELPRMQQELENMYERIPALAVRNLGRERLSPLPDGGRRGGDIQQLQTVTVEQAQAWLDNHYKPNNAVLVLAGAIDVEAARDTIEQKFGAVPPGKTPAATTAGHSDDNERNVEIQARAHQPDERARVGLTFAGPNPDDELYPAFLVHVARMQMSGRQLVDDLKYCPVAYMPVDQPRFLYVSLPVGTDETALDVATKLREFVDQKTGMPLTRMDPRGTKMAVGILLGLGNVRERELARHPYGAAFSLGRRHQMGIDPAALNQAIDEVTDQQLRRAQREFFAQINSVEVLVRPR